jgi:hypothetical protein
MHPLASIASIMMILPGLTIACGRPTPTSKVQLDSAHIVAVDAMLPVGTIQTTARDEASIRQEIEAQLFYAIGQLNGINGGADMADVMITDIQLPESLPAEGEYFVARYVAKMAVAWPREQPIPTQYDFYLPKGGDYQWLQRFFDEFDGRCIDPAAHDYDASIFWYYYRPQNCDLKLGSESGTAIQVTADFINSTRNTEGKSPEYGKIWEDERLVVTAIFGKDQDGATNEWDAGISAYNEMYRSLIRKYGRPDYSSVKLRRRQVPGTANPVVLMQWEHDRGEIDVMIMLVDGIRSTSQEFKKVYNERTKISDLVSYSGHSGLGANIRALARMGSFVKDQYKIFFINGCDTYAYVDSALEEAHQAVNPESPGSKYVDIITNAMPSYFSSNASTNMALIDALGESRATYREILRDFDMSQRALVTGEEDNRWPLPFGE